MSKDMPLVSVVVPVYNGEDYLPNTFQYLQKQTWQEYEVILVDDCSGDSTEDILKSFAAHDSRFSYIRHKENQGCGAARNTGLAAAKGEYAVCLDADDIFADDLLRKMVDALVSSKADVVVCNSIVTDQMSGKSRYFGQWRRLMEIMEEDCMTVEKPATFPGICELIDYVTWSKMFRLSFFRKEALWFPNLKYYEDIPFSFLSCLLAERIVFLRQPLIHYSTRKASSMTAWKDPKEFYIADAFYYIWRNRGRLPWNVVGDGLMARVLNNIGAVYSYATEEERKAFRIRFSSRLWEAWKPDFYAAKGFLKPETLAMLERIRTGSDDVLQPVLLCGDSVGICACSDPLPRDKIDETKRLEELLRRLGLCPVFTPSVLKESSHFGEDDLQKRVVWMMELYRNPDISVIFDISGGDLANEILPGLDYDIIRNSKKIFAGYSDLTCIINAIYKKTGLPSLLYRICNLYKDRSGQQMIWFRKTFMECASLLTDFSYVFYRGDFMEGIVVGGNIRCLLKLAGTEYWPEMAGKLLFLESLDTSVTAARAYAAQLLEMGVFLEVSGVILGTFGMGEGHEITEIDRTLLKQIPQHIPVAKTKEIGHGYLSKAIWIGKYLRLDKERRGAEDEDCRIETDS